MFRRDNTKAEGAGDSAGSGQPSNVDVSDAKTPERDLVLDQFGEKLEAFQILRKSDPARPMLYRARRDAELLTPGFKRNPLGVPTFLFGGAVLSGILNLVQRAVVAAVSAWWAKALITVAMMVLFLGASWVVLRGAAFARRRIVMTTVQPLGVLWETIGRCGKPPQDSSKSFALIAPIGVVLTVFT